MLKKIAAFCILAATSALHFTMDRNTIYSDSESIVSSESTASSRMSTVEPTRPADLYPLSYHNKTDRHILVTIQHLLAGIISSRKSIVIPAKTCVRFFHCPEELELFHAALKQPSVPLMRYITVTSSTNHTTELSQHLSPENISTIRTVTATHLSKREQIGCKVSLQ